MFINGFPKLMRLQTHHDKVLKKFLPRLKKHLDKNGIDTGLYTLKWFFQCFLDRVIKFSPLFFHYIKKNGICMKEWEYPSCYNKIYLVLYLGSFQHSNKSVGFVSFGRRKGINSYGLQYSPDAQTVPHASW